MYLTLLVTIQIGVELAAVQRKLPDRAVVGLQLYSAWTFHVNLLNLCVPCTIEFQSRRSLPTNLTAKVIPERAWR